jgi:ABC-type transport system involved in cytochrome c biogenesis permease subunit
VVIAVAAVLVWLALLTYLVYPGRVATALAWAAWLVLLGGLVERAALSGHWPLSNRHEFALTCAWWGLGIYLLLEAGWHERRAGAFGLAAAALMIGYAVTRSESARAVAPLLPVLRSPWLQLHALSAAVGYAVMGVAAGFGLGRLIQARWPARLPAAEDLEWMMSRSLTLGFPWLTFSLLAGAIWAQAAWGRLWAWDPKETWALVVWLWYLMLLHLHPLSRWRGRRLAMLLLIGYAGVVFTFIGVPWLVQQVRLESLHGF